MFYSPASFTAAACKFDTGVAVLGAATDKLLAACAHLLDMQVNVAKATVIETALLSRQAMTQRGGDFVAEGARYGQMQLARAFSYGNDMAGIIGGMQGELAAMIGESTLDARRKSAALLAQ